MHKSRRKSKPTRSVPIIALLVAMIGVGLFGLHLWEKNELEKEALEIEARSSDSDLLPEQLTVYYQGNWYQLRNDLKSYLLLGIDKFEDTAQTTDGAAINKQQSDFLLLMIADENDRSYTALQLNRDTMCEVQILGKNGQVISTQTMQLALSHTYGSGGKDSCRNSVKAVSRLLYDVPIDHYFAVTMDAIPVLNDLVGGVTVTIEEDLTAIDPSFTEGRTVLLKGDQSLLFVRTRMQVSDGTNISRMSRQRTYMDALYSQMSRRLRESSGFALTLADTLAPYMVSDLITDEMAQLADQLKDYRFNGIITVEGTADYSGHFAEFYPDETDLQSKVIRLFFELQK
ncbi:MAG: LCP family protein [Oscillospiraceae bacterium]|nr:LCP family protein [Oscillospiraceae bacterium]